MGGIGFRNLIAFNKALLTHLTDGKGPQGSLLQIFWHYDSRFGLEFIVFVAVYSVES